MMEDIAPELLEKLQAVFAQALADGDAAALLQRLENGALWSDAQDYAFAVGDALANVLAAEISSAALPDGKLYYNIADRVLRPLLERDHTLVTSYAAKVQQALNDSAGIGIRAQTASINTKRVDGLINLASTADQYDDVAAKLQRAARLYSQSVADETLKANVNFLGRSGLRAKVTRRAEAGCCKWCRAMAGTYAYPDVPDGAYRRHENCRCTLEYDPGNGKKQTLWQQGDAAQQRAQEKARRDRINRYNAMTDKERQRYDAAAAARKRFAERQEYRRVTRGEATEFNSPKMGRIKARRITTYDTPVYVSDDAIIKPRALHNINKNTEEALRAYGIPAGRKPTMVILSDREMSTAWGRYDAISNTVYYVPQVADKHAVGQLGSTEYHEMWHAKQAEDFRAQGWTITEDNYGEYLAALRAKCKTRLDSEGITRYNAGEISPYAEKQYLLGRYDETEAEYQTEITRKAR